MRFTHRIGLTLVAAAIVGVYGCSKEEPKQAAVAPAAAPAPTEETMTVTIAHAGPLTGSIAHLGKEHSLHVSGWNMLQQRIDDCDALVIETRSFAGLAQLR